MRIKTLPIGTVVQLTNYKTKVMICGRQQISSEDNLTYDYSGCDFSNRLDGDSVILFNANQVTLVYPILTI